MRYIFLSPLTVEDCQQRLSSNIDMTSSVFGYSSKSSYRGKVQVDTGLIELDYRPVGRNSFSPIFFGKVLPNDNQGSQIIGSFMLHPFVKALLIFWLAFAYFFISLVTAMEIREYFAGEMTIQKETLFVLIFPVFGYGLLQFGRMIGKENEEKIIRFYLRLSSNQYTIASYLPN